MTTSWKVGMSNIFSSKVVQNFALLPMKYIDVFNQKLLRTLFELWYYDYLMRLWPLHNHVIYWLDCFTTPVTDQLARQDCLLSQSHSLRIVPLKLYTDYNPALIEWHLLVTFEWICHCIYLRFAVNVLKLLWYLCLKYYCL